MTIITYPRCFNYLGLLRVPEPEISSKSMLIDHVQTAFEAIHGQTSKLNMHVFTAEQMHRD